MKQKNDVRKPIVYNDPAFFDYMDHMEIITDKTTLVVPGLERSVKQCIIDSMQGISYRDNGQHLYQNDSEPSPLSNPYADQFEVMNKLNETRSKIDDSKRDAEIARKKVQSAINDALRSKDKDAVKKDADAQQSAS